MKKYFILSIIYYLGILSNIEAQSNRTLSNGGITPIFAQDLKAIHSTSPYIDTTFIRETYSPQGDKIDPPIWRLEDSRLIVGLYLMKKNNTSDDIQIDSIKIRGRINCRPSNTVYPFLLRLDNNHQKNNLAKDELILSNIQWASIEIDSVYISSHTILPDSLFSLEYSIQGKGYNPVVLNPDGTVRNDFLEIDLHDPSLTNGYCIVQLPFSKWAESYDLEWMFVDAIDIPSSGSFTPNFYKNSSRVNLQGVTTYDLPLIYPAGRLYFRARNVGRFADGRTFRSNWSNPKYIPIVQGQSFENSSKLYQYNSAFAENGKRKDLIGYYDGSGRNRQNITRLNSQPNTIIVGETFYDHLGRATITTLPAPLIIDPGIEQEFNINAHNNKTNPNENLIKNPFAERIRTREELYGHTDVYRLTHPDKPVNKKIQTLGWENWIAYQDQRAGLNYKENFTLNTSDVALSRKDFDLKVADCQVYIPPALSKLSGAGKYYSDANDIDEAINKDFIPDGNGYPYLQTLYDDDLAGRVRAQGMAGNNLRIGSGHEIKKEITTPSQDEMDKIFGTDIGIASNYFKHISIDQNGQQSVTYSDKRGKVIATALIGNSPTALTSIIPGDLPQNTLNIENEHRAGAPQSKSNSNFYIAMDNTPVNVHYKIDHAALQINNPCINNASICYDCMRYLVISLKDDCNRVIFEKKSKIGPQNDQNINVCNPSIFNFDTSVVLNKGNYFISKTLEVIENDKSKYLVHYIQLDTSCFNPNISINTCSSSSTICDTCTYDRRFVRIDGREILILERKTNNNPSCTRRCGQNIGHWPVDDYERLLSDVRPGGLYGAISPTDTIGGKSWHLSLFNPANILVVKTGPSARPLSSLTNNYITTPSAYRDPSGELAKIPISALSLGDYLESNTFTENGIRYIRPNSVLNIEKLRSIWKDSWSESLVFLHPEYNYFEFNYLNFSARIFQDTISKVGHEAFERNWINTVGDLLPLITRDPFFIRFPRLAPYMQALVANSLDGLNITQSVAHTLKCVIIPPPVVNDDVFARRTLSPEEISCAQNNANLFFSPNTTSEELDEAWTTYRSIYFGKRQILMDSIREVALTNSGLGPGYTEFVRLRSSITNACIGASDESCPCPPSLNLAFNLKDTLMKYGKKRFINYACLAGGDRPPSFESIDDNTAGSARNALEADPYVISLRQLDQWQRCSGTCAITFDFMTWLNQLATQGKLASSYLPVFLPRYRPSANMLNLIPNFRHATGNLQYTSSIENSGKTLSIKLSKGDNILNFKLTSGYNRVVPWSTIDFLTCIREGNDDIFSIKAYDQDNTENTFVDSLIIYGDIINHFNSESCNIYFIGNASINPSQIGEIIRNYAKIRNLDTATLRPLPSLCCIQPSPRIFPKPFCDTDLLNALTNQAIQDKKLERARKIYDSLNFVYNNKCLSSISESFTISYSQPIYHYTLYYYDQSGNLMKTLPPKAVRPFNAAEVAQVTAKRAANDKLVPAHNTALATTYTYNSFGQKKTRTTPDNGTTRWVYDEVGRSIMEISDQHRADGVIAYNLYDEKSRPVENGYVKGISFVPASIQAPIMKYDQYKAAINFTNQKLEVARTIYDIASGDPSINERFIDGRQSHLRNRVSAILYRDSLPPTDRFYDHAMYFNYDIAGNMREVLMDYKALYRVLNNMENNTNPVLEYQRGAGLHDHEKKLIRYQYDQITGKVTEVAYQPDKPDQFYHWYSYDADNRLTKVETGRSRFEPDQWRETDLEYKYYLHGPVARAELGEEKIQALDMAYTINGWLKQVNSPSRTRAMDPGDDDPINSGFLADAFGFQLSYFDNDYKPIGREAIANDVVAGNDPLYNGNIRRSILRNEGQATNTISAQLYRYDQANRLVDFKFGELPDVPENIIAATNDHPTWYNINNNIWTIGDKYRMSLSYDPNGNITELSRKDGSGNVFDKLSYQYQINNNKLDHIKDDAGYTESIHDLKNQDIGNYSYDIAGRLTGDKTDKESHNIRWTHRDKIKSFLPTTSKKTPTLFRYDALGRRALKMTGDKATYTVRDFAGNIMATYDITMGKENKFTITLSEIPFYSGGGRIGSWNTKIPLTNKNMEAPDSSSIQLIRGEKLYECKNQTGDILALISDKRSLHTNDRNEPIYTADILQATDYYPFGMEMPGRKMDFTKYRYGFQGMEKDDDLKGDGNSISTEFRQYDPRVGRWLSVDPMMEKYALFSPYNSFENQPISFIDLDGQEVTFTDFRRRSDDKHVIFMYIHGKIKDETGQGYSQEQLQEYATRMEQGLRGIYAIRNEDIEMHVIPRITVASENNPILPSDHVIHLRANGDLPADDKGNYHPAYSNITGTSRYLNKAIYINERLLSTGRPAQDKISRFYGTGLNNIGLSTIESVIAHEMGHSLGLVHSDRQYNLMSPTDGNGGLEVTTDQIRTILYKYKQGELNKPIQDVD